MLDGRRCRRLCHFCIMSKRLFDEVDEDGNHAAKRRRRESSRNTYNTTTTSFPDTHKQLQQSKSNKPGLRLHLLSRGYVRKNFNTRNINPCDIAQIIVKFLFQDWKFDYCFDFGNQGSTIHGIKNNGKTIECNCKYSCYCFYSIFSIGMKPKSGKHRIKFKINKIHNSCANIIGIISENCKNNNKRMWQ